MEDRKEDENEGEKREEGPTQETENKNNTNSGSSSEVFNAKGGINPHNLLKIQLRDNTLRYSEGRHVKSLSNRGRYIGYRIPKGKIRDIALDATIKASAPYQRDRLEESQRGIKLIIKKEDLREKVRGRKTMTNILFVVDASGSMGVMRRMEAVKGAILSILMDAYQKRNRVAMITFRGNETELILPFTTSVDLAERSLKGSISSVSSPLKVIIATLFLF